MYGVGWFSAYLIWINLINFSSLIHIESMLARLAGSLVLFVLREFSFECSRSHSVILCRVETRIFRLGTFAQGQHPRSFIQPRKIIDQYFLLTNRPKRFKGKNNGGRVSSEMNGGKQSSESGQMRKDIDSTQRGRVLSFQVLGSMLDYVWSVSSKTGIMTTSDNFTTCHTGTGRC